MVELALFLTLFYRQVAALAYLNSSLNDNLGFLTDGSGLSFGKGGSSVLASCSYCAAEVTLAILHALC